MPVEEVNNKGQYLYHEVVQLKEANKPTSQVNSKSLITTSMKDRKISISKKFDRTKSKILIFVQ